MLRFHSIATVLAATSAFALTIPARAQSAPPPAQPLTVPGATPDADALAASMRRLADDPRNLDALITAGELSLKVGDASGAAALFKRAEGVDPMNGRIKAGMARILVTQERPGEALRYFDQAVGYGLDPRTFAGDRGLAFDLIGEQERAQRDYRLALKTADNDEVRRRYALSLGISGRQDAALAEIDTLLRRNDRGAWRARAFILAMTGDVAGATGIATRMMPPAMAQGLQPFFVRLPTLAATDKAFAVHFGEVRATPARLADARLTPVLPVLGPDPDARARVAVAAVVPQPLQRGRDRRRRERTPQVLVAAAAPKVAALPPAPGFGRAGESPTDPARAGSLAPTRIAAAATPPNAVAPPPRYVRRGVDPIQKSTLADYAQVERYNRALEAQARAAALRGSPPATTPAPAVVQVAVTPSPPPAVTLAAPTTSSPPASAAVGGPAVQLAAVGPSIAAPVVAQPLAAVVPQAAPGTPAPAPSPQAVASATPAPTAPRASEDSILARIVAGLTVPGYELGVGPPPPQPAPAPVLLADAPGAAPVLLADRPSRLAADAARGEASASAPVKPPKVVPTRPAAPKAIADRATTRSGRGVPSKVELAEAEPAPRTRADAAKARGKRVDPDATTPDDAFAPAGRRRGDRRALAAKDEPDSAPTRDPRRRGTDRRPLAAAEADEPKGKGRSRRDAAKKTEAEPPRIWVQVAGGANQGDLPKAWSSVQSRAAALKGREAYSTPLRATNRVVTGPFKTDAEARAFVNQLAKQGVSAFPFTSDKGQKLAKLPPK